MIQARGRGCAGECGERGEKEEIIIRGDEECGIFKQAWHVRGGLGVLN